MKKCHDCTHVEMCGWRKEVKEQGCEFFDDGMVWIPCSERMPIDGGNYLITVADLRLGHIGERTVTTADFYAKEKKWNSVADVYAWMPLPKPYKGGEDE